MPPVTWGGKYNTIIAPIGNHVSEAKWLKCGKRLIEDFTKFWLEEKSNTYWYSTWIVYSVYEYCSLINDFSFGINNLDLLIKYHEKTEDEHMTKCGLLWSIDDNDAMEYSISGVTESLEFKPGLRPTMNSCMAASALAISELAKKAGKAETAAEYYNKYKSIKEKMAEVLWDGDFYKAIHTDDFDEILRTYAESQSLTLEDGRKVCWIDEVKDPETNEWSSRNILKDGGWDKVKGGLERGKDYNHSTFCDNVLGGLLGISTNEGKLSVTPLIPDDWDYFAVDNLVVNEKCYRIVYDKNGDRYGLGKGITVLEK